LVAASLLWAFRGENLLMKEKYAAVVRVPRVEVGLDSTWVAVFRAFRDVPALAMGQAWRAAPERGFLPAAVRVGWRGGALLVLANLADRDIFNRARPLNDLTWEMGDVFEIFLRPVGQAAYYEFHVAPRGQLLQLRFPRAGALAARRRTGLTDYREILAPFFLASPIRVRTRIRGGAAWDVLAEIPLVRFCETPRAAERRRVRFSFSRYDYTRGRRAPVLSSTSAHPEPSFHRQREWGTLACED
jgi:hypothetical protein